MKPRSRTPWYLHGPGRSACRCIAVWIGVRSSENSSAWSSRKNWSMDTFEGNHLSRGLKQMRHRLLASLGVLAVAFAFIALTSSLAAGQTPKSAHKTTTPAKNYVPPKTPWGDPDLQGTWTSDDYIGTPMQRAANLGTKAFFTEEEVAQRQTQLTTQAQNDLQEFANPNGRASTGPPGHWGERARRPPLQTSLVVDPPDGRIPDLVPEARTGRSTGIGAGNNNPDPASWEDFSTYIRCITRGVAGSILPVIYGNGAQIVQGQGYVAIMQEMVHEARIIPLNATPHVSSKIRTYMGDSRGHWEGNTLVIETTNIIAGKTGIGANGGGTATSDALKLTERFTRTAADVIKYELKVDDPKTYTKPFTISYPLTQEPGYENFEYACHEGNYGMHNQLSAARAVDKKAAEEAAKK